MDCKIKWLGQAGYLIAIGDISLCIDPYLSNSVEEIEGLKRLVPPPIAPSGIHVSYMLFTHDHLDHFDEPSLRQITDERTVYVGPKSCMDRLDWIPSERKIEIACGNSVALGALTLRAVFASHTADSVGYILQEGAQGGIYLTGDTLYDDRLLAARNYSPSALFVCINGKLGNMNYQQAAQLAQELGVRTAVPCHYGMFAENTEDPVLFTSLLQNSPVHCLTLGLGETHHITI